MPDTLGRYTVTEMEDRINRLLDGIQATINMSTGAETNPVIQEQNYSTVDMLQQINASLTGLYSEMILGREEQFAQTVYQTLTANNAGPYLFPPNMLQLRYMYYLPDNINFNQAIPEQWVPMPEFDDQSDLRILQQYRAPAWRWEGNGFILWRNPQTTNPNNVRMSCVIMPAELVNQTDVIQVRFVRVMQQAVIYDAAYNLAWSKMKQVSDEISKGRDEWHTRLISTVLNAYHTTSTQMVTDRFLRQTYTGR